MYTNNPKFKPLKLIGKSSVIRMEYVATTKQSHAIVNLLEMCIMCETINYDSLIVDLKKADKHAFGGATK